MENNHMSIISGIYEIFNVVNGHRYIGSSSNVCKRWKRHKWCLSKNKHHSIYLQRAYNLYTKECFIFTVIEEVEENRLFERETYYINELKPEYNLGSVGGGDNISNHPNSEAIKDKHSKNLTERLASMSEEERKSWHSRFGEYNPNWKGGVSQKVCSCGKNMSYHAKVCSECREISGNKNPFYGKRHSNESKEKQRLKMIGRKPANSKQITINGITYKSQSDAARALGVVPAMITYRIKNGIYTVTAPKSNLG